ncbi:1-deoxy-D-xylulose-5-phosphate reductoisomerase [Lachnoanaerobaculum umeaense]|uniref:1-deoxy-D-xylulose 5-phosphate reductoisomerase n=1 Tax=Lachnoanaerobaculum umeaense TaxID=617123 RepID=A0A385PZD3_9FIRM|nr:1-deoxy-D-xylulose-5-phosphate reductoisomerase [Lachnoanaerobaculum umeaense]AYA99531.1 1-deoxy-D-xylulose-5-phosphate reductoisomerase [Lachnoanaerobaculum umeaense]PZW95872.1 1-deoxy-D-xylulose 5-phosphate reductoisomerase [Lachnoanaerobaculum umeaense]
MKKISILGSTGSIGTQTLDIARLNQDVDVVALSAHKNIDLLEKQIREFKPQIVAIWEESDAELLSKRIKDLDVKVYFGMEGLIKVTTADAADIVVTAVVGMIGIEPTIAAIKAGKDIALANKETLVCAGHIIMPLAKDMGINIYPVDSEHSAIFQCLDKHNPIKKILLTASGGPFRGFSKEELQNVTLEDALKHPNWSMGKKITIDSATMINKGLEIIEASHLFDVNIDDIEVVIQKESIIHSMVEFKDNGIIAQLGTPDMKLPISYAIFYPERRYISDDRVDFNVLSTLNFSKPDLDVFEGLKLAILAGKKGGSAPTVLNAANEWAVDKFLNKKIRFVDIPYLIGLAVENHKFTENPSLEDILYLKQWTEDYLERIKI